MSELRARVLRYFALAWVATLMLVVAPSIANMGGTPAGTSFTEICTALGIQLVPVDANGSDGAPASDSAGGSCPLCLLQATPALPTTPTSADATHASHAAHRITPPPADVPSADDPANPPPSRAPPHLHH